MSRQNNSDLLPYREVDRALKPKLPLLAGVMCVTPQHALGSLLEWWDLCADPRELERIAAEALAKNEEPAVVLTADDVAMRFELASGKRVEPIKLVMLGFLEQRGENAYRVRGMSRDFKPIVRRLANRDAASKGGKKSAEVRAAAHGTAQPQGGKGSKPAPVAASSAAQATNEAQPNQEPKRDRSESRSASEAERNSSGQRSAVSDTSSLRSEVCGADAPATHAKAPGPEVDLVDADTPPDIADGANGFWRRAQETRVELGAVRERPPHPRGLGTWWSLALSEVGGDERRLWRAWLLYLEDKHWRAAGSPWAGWVSQWAQFATRAGATSSTVTGAGTSALACTVCGCELVDGARDERCVCGPTGLPLCRADNDRLVEDVGNAVWADGWAQTDAAKKWLAGARGRPAA